MDMLVIIIEWFRKKWKYVKKRLFSKNEVVSFYWNILLLSSLNR